MLKDALTIFSKEFKNVFKDKRAVFANYILPLLLMPVLFIGIDYFTGQQITQAQEKIYPIHFVNPPPQPFEEILGQFLSYTYADEGFNRESLTITFPRDFQPGRNAEVEIYADSTSTPFSLAANQVQMAVRQYNQYIASDTLSQAGIPGSILETISIRRIDTAPEEAQGSHFLAMMLPYLLLIYLFAGAMSMGMNITAGEKERGGLASLLVNQVSRSSIALGKTFFLIASAMISAITSAIGIIIAIRFSPSMFGGAEASALSLLQPFNILSLILTILTAGGVSAAIIVLLGSLSRNMKEASGYITPVYIVVVMAGVITMNLDATNNLLFFAIPLGNLIFMLKGIITSQYTLVQLLITLGVNVLSMGILVWLTSRLYNSERILNTGA